MKSFPPTSKTTQPDTQKGSALFMILIAVVLFAALSYSIAQMMRSGNPMMVGEEKARLYADEILNYARAMRQAAQSVRISGGCSSTGISFENATLMGYAHSPVVADACKIFSDRGGSMNYLPPSADWLDMVYTPPPAQRGQWIFPANLCVPNIGEAVAGCESDGVDNEALVATLMYVREQVCVELNKLLGVTNIGSQPPPLVYTGNINITPFTGTQSDAGSIELNGKMAGCYEGTGSLPAGTYHFYQVLMPR